MALSVLGVWIEQGRIAEHVGAPLARRIAPAPIRFRSAAKAEHRFVAQLRMRVGQRPFQPQRDTAPEDLVCFALTAVCMQRRSRRKQNNRGPCDSVFHSAGATGIAGREQTKAVGDNVVAFSVTPPRVLTGPRRGKTALAGLHVPLGGRPDGAVPRFLAFPRGYRYQLPATGAATSTLTPFYPEVNHGS